MERHGGRALAVAFALSWVSTFAWAQQTAATLSGVVTDTQAASVPGAKVTLVDQDQASTVRAVITETDGSFVIYPLNPANYTLTVEAPGFKRYEQRDIRLFANGRVGLNIQLELGEVTESVLVEAQAVQLETASAMRTGVVTGNQVLDIGLNGRGYIALAATVAGVYSSYSNETAGNSGAGSLNVNGMRGTQNITLEDGLPNTEPGNNGTQLTTLNLDAVAEFKLVQNSESAEYGAVSGASVVIVSKSGSKEFHGAGYFFHRHEDLNANQWVNNINGAQRPLYRFNYQGYNIGGPVYIPGKFNRNKDKLFFFWTQEWDNQKSPNPNQFVTVPTAAERTGDFSLSHVASGAIQIIKDPTTGQPFPGNQVPQSRWNADGAKILNEYPLPNIAGLPNYNFQSQDSDTVPRRDNSIRGDWNISDKWRLFARVNWDNNPQLLSYGSGTGGTYNLPFGYFNRGNTPRNTVLNLTTVISPTLTNQFIAGVAWVISHNELHPDLTPKFFNSSLNPSFQLPFEGASSMLPNFNFGGVPNPPTSNFAGLPYRHTATLLPFTDNLSKVYGPHQFKAGFFLERVRVDQTAYSATNGTIWFDQDSANPGDTNWAFSNALVGNYRELQQANVIRNGRYRYSQAEWYLADTWKARPNLTLDYGIRFNIIQPQYDSALQTSSFNAALWNPSQAAVLYQQVKSPQGQLAALNPLTGALYPAVYIGALVPGTGKLDGQSYINGLGLAGVDNYPRGLIKHRGVQYGPRLGVAWEFAPKTVFRAGGGVFYERFQGNPVFDMLPNPPSTLLPTLYYGNLTTIGSTPGVSFPANPLYGFSEDGKIGTVYNWNISIQRQLPSQILLDVAYVGNLGRHLLDEYDVNRPGFGSAWLPQNQDPTVTPKFDGTTSLPANLYRPYSGYGDIYMFEFGASSNYHALQVSATRRLTSGLQVGAAYTWSRAMGTASNDTTVIAPVDAKMGSYAPLSFDRRQLLVINYIYNVPKLARQGNFLGNPLGRAIFNNWTLSGITTMITGAPLSVSYSISGVSSVVLARTVTGDETYGPRVAATGVSATPSSHNQYEWINSAAFAPAAKPSLGLESAADGYVYGPAYQNWDVSAFKSFPYSADNKRYIQLRLEAFNAPNHPEFSGVNTTLVFNSTGHVTNLPTALGGTGGRFGFGAITSTRDPRIVQIAAKIYF